jgi:hypothetical protein
MVAAAQQEARNLQCAAHRSNIMFNIMFKMTRSACMSAVPDRIRRRNDLEASWSF